MALLSVVVPLGVSSLGIVLIVLGAVLLLFFIGGVLGALTRDRRQAGVYAQHVADADQALEQARAADRGWNRDVMETAAREAITEARPGWDYQDLHLILVDDRPGVDEDHAHFVAVAGDGEVRVVLGRQGDRWSAERVE